MKIGSTLWALASGCDPVFLLGADTSLCRCSSDYTDSLEFRFPEVDKILTVESDRSGVRFKSSESHLPSPTSSHLFFQRYTSVKWDSEAQVVRGFGGSLTDATLIQYANLTNDLQEQLLQSWFGPHGSEFSLIRLPIGGTDFSTYPYSLDDGGIDFDLNRFDLSAIDYQLRLPVIKKIEDMATNVDYFGSMWSPPVWLKGNGKFNGIGGLRGSPGDIYHKTLARYYRRYIDLMAYNGVDIMAITSQNEPTMGLFIASEWNALGWSPRHLRDWLEKDLIPELRNSSTAIWLFDDNRIVLKGYVDFLMSSEVVRNETSGIALHWYWDKIYPSTVVKNIHSKYPEHELIASEACTVRGTKGRELKLAWKQGEDYSKDIIQDFHAGVTAWVDWNLSLDMTGGPNWAGNHRNAPILVDSENDEFYRLPIYYHLAHFSKFFSPGTRVLKSSSENSLFGRRPDGYFVGVVVNPLNIGTGFAFIDANGRPISFKLTPRSIVSLLWQ